ncbi:MAG: hypothetical protein ACPGTO_10765 [Polaribacter sp.]
MTQTGTKQKTTLKMVDDIYTLVINSIKAMGRISSGGSTLTIAPVLKKFMVHFRRPSSYQGEYGFDWLRDEYIYPVETVAKDHSGNPHNAPLELCDDISSIKREYKTTDVLNPITPYGNDYYPAWLTLFPNTPEAQATHSSQIDTTGIDLNLKIEELEPLATDATELQFESSNPNLIITPRKLALSSLLSGKGQDSLGGTDVRDYYLAINKVNIKCEGNINAHTEIKVFAELNSQREEVGKLMICKNDDYNDLTVDIYVIKSFINDDPSFSTSVIDTELAKIGGISKIEEYLNQRSLNQSLIKTRLIYDPKKDWVFRKKSLINASNSTHYSGMIINQTTMEMDTAKYMNYINDRFKLMYPRLTRSKALFLYITPFFNSGVGGASYNIPLDSKHIIIFKKNINHLPSYAHEIGHSLGLEHSFEDDTTKSNTSLIADQNTKIATYTTELAKARTDKTTHLNTNRAYYNSHPTEKTEAVRTLNHNIKVWKDALQNANDEIQVINNNALNFSPRKTENIMDYDLSNQKIFFKWQSKIMREEVKQYYH